VISEALSRFDVVVVPFPFVDSPQAKRRPALILSGAELAVGGLSHRVMAMVTSAANPPWPLDVRIQDLGAAGLPAPSVVRMKLFTLDHRLVLARAGRLSPRDRKSVTLTLRELLGL
jgi:mRNA interferase MazF